MKKTGKHSPKKQQKQRSQNRGQDRRSRASSWLAIGTVGTVVAYSAVGGKGVTPAHAFTPFPAGQAAVQTPGVYQFDIAPGLLDDVIDAFEAATGIEITLARAGFTSIPSPGVRGQYSADQALRQILAGTGIAFQYDSPNAVLLDLQTSTTIDVLGVALPTIESPKFTAALVDTPQSIAIISDRVFNEQGAQNLTEVLRNTPGITFDAGENGFASGTSNFGIRGFDSSGSVFVDGARDSGNYFRDVFNVEQVEIAKGPAGDNGRSSAGGYVNLSTKTPQAGNFYGGTFGYGFDGTDSINRPRLTLDVNQQLNDGTAFRLNALWQDGGVPGRLTAEKNSWGIAPSLAFGLDGPTRLTLSYQHLEQNDLPDWGVPGALFEDTFWYIPAAGGESNRAVFYGHASDYDDVTSDSAVVRFEHDFAASLRFSNQTRWSNTEREALYALPTGYVVASGLVTTQRQGYQRENSAVTNTTNIASFFDTGAVRHSLATGIEFSRENSSANRYPSNGPLGNPGSVSPSNPDPNRTLTGFVGLNATQTADVEIDTVAAYLYDTLTFLPQWQVTGGLRVEHYGVAIESRTAAGAPQGPDGFDRTDTTVSGKIGLVYKPAGNGSFYAAVGVSALPPGSYLSNPDISRESDNAFPGWSAGQNSAASKAQRSTNFEIGTKWDAFGERFSASSAYFRTVRSNIAMAGTVDGVANSFVEYASQVVQGVELGASGYVTPEWSILGGVVFMDSERRHSPAVDAARMIPNADDYNQQAAPHPNENPQNPPKVAVSTTNGQELAFTPKASANIWTTYRVPAGLTFGGGVRYVGDSYIGRPDNAERIISNTRYGKFPGHTVLDLMAAYDINRNLTLRFNADNVTNTFYTQSVNWNGQRVALGPARSFRVSTDVRF